MAQRCGTCGSADTTTGLDAFTCLSCGASTPYREPTNRGRVDNPDGVASYYGDPVPTSEPEPEPAPKKKGRRG